MAIHPEATYRPISVNKGRQKMAAYNRVNFHVAVSESADIYGVFNQAGKPDSHFYVLRGTPEQIANRQPANFIQYVDTAYRAFADLEGNDATISVETQGGVKDADTTEWDVSQLLRLADIFAWAHTKHSVPNKIATDSKPGSSSHGMSWHRLGVDGNFPALPDVRAGRLQRGGGMHYSTSRGKLCPGGFKVQQIEEAFEIAQSLIGVPVKAVEPVKTAPATATPAKTGPATTTPVTGKITVDGWWGLATTGLAQQVAGTPVDKIVSSQAKANKRNNLGSSWEWVPNSQATGSTLIRKLQTLMKSRGCYAGQIDGHAGPKFWAGFQKIQGTTTMKQAIEAFQSNLNTGKLWKDKK